VEGEGIREGGEGRRPVERSRDGRLRVRAGESKNGKINREEREKEGDQQSAYVCIAR